MYVIKIDFERAPYDRAVYSSINSREDLAYSRIGDPNSYATFTRTEIMGTMTFSITIENSQELHDMMGILGKKVAINEVLDLKKEMEELDSSIKDKEKFLEDCKRKPRDAIEDLEI